MDADELLRRSQERRVLQYAQCLFALERTTNADGAEGTFDQALTNALTAIVVDTWPGKERKSGRILSAAVLLEVIEENGNAVSPGVVAVPHHPRHDPPWGQAPPPWRDDVQPLPNATQIEVTALRDGITATQPARHGRDVSEDGTGLRTEHVRALSKLKWHPVMRSAMTDFLRDRHFDLDQRADSVERLRAVSYLEAIGEDETERRARVEWTAERYEEPGADVNLLVDECPVCGNDSLIATGVDTWGELLATGHCGVCSYQRTQGVADHDATARMVTRAVDKGY